MILRCPRREGLELLGVGDRVGQTLGVREVGSEDDPVGADGLDEADRVFLEEGVDPDVAPQDRDRVLLVETSGCLAYELPQGVDEREHPARAVLDREDAQAGEAGEHAVGHRRAHGVEDAAAHEVLHVLEGGWSAKGSSSS